VAIALVAASCAARMAATGMADGMSVIDEHCGPMRVVVVAIGSPPVTLQPGVTRINGCEVLVLRDGQEEPVYAECHGELDPDLLIDRADLGAGVLRITSLTTDPRMPDLDVPFIRTTLRFAADDLSIEREVLLPPGDADDASLEQWVGEIVTHNAAPRVTEEQSRAAGAAVDCALGHLRNAAVSRPDAVLGRLQALPRLNGDCECEHWKGAYVGEVMQLRRLQREQ
jgi:hypothetical protein